MSRRLSTPSLAVADAAGISRFTNLRMIASGMTSDDISDNAVALASLADAVTLTDTEATVTRVIEQGDVKGTVTQTLDAGQEGAVTQTQTTKIAEVGDVNATALVPWRNEINHLTKRMGNLRAKILDSATESLDYGSRCMPRRAGFTHGNFGFGVAQSGSPEQLH